MTTVLTVLVLAALVALVLRQLEVNHRRSRTGVAAALGSVALDRDAERVSADLRAEPPSRSTGRRTPSTTWRQPVGFGHARHA